MQQEWLLYPIFAMFLITAFTSIRMLKLRIKAVKAGEVKVSYFRLNQGQELPKALRQTERHYENLFEFPVLYYVIIIMIYITEQANYGYLVLAWLFVFSRIAHAYIHLGHNNVIHRKNAFLASWVVLVGLWGYLFFDLITN